MKDIANLNSVSTGLHQMMLNIVYRFLVLALAGTLPDSSYRDTQDRLDCTSACACHRPARWELCLGFPTLTLRVPGIAYAHRPI
jgi:hypothetical protein